MREMRRLTKNKQEISFPYLAYLKRMSAHFCKEMENHFGRKAASPGDLVFHGNRLRDSLCKPSSPSCGNDIETPIDLCHLP